MLGIFEEVQSTWDASNTPRAWKEAGKAHKFFGIAHSVVDRAGLDTQEFALESIADVEIKFDHNTGFFIAHFDRSEFAQSEDVWILGKI